MRERGWFYVILGLVLFVAGLGGLGTLLDPTASKIYLGAVFIGPILFARGVFLLRKDQEIRESHPLPDLSETSSAADLYEEELRDGSIPTPVVCAGCKEEYVYFPMRAAEAAAARHGRQAAAHQALRAFNRNCAMAPCPRCGWIQPDMFEMAREHAPQNLFLWCGGGLILLSIGFFIYLQRTFVTPWAEGRGEGTPLIYWIVQGFLVILAAGAMVWGALEQARWDPNSQPVETRLRLGRKLSLMREEYEAARDAAHAQEEPEG